MIRVHFLTYFLILLYILCGRFNYFIIIFIILFFHDLGHIITMHFFNVDIDLITILPFGSIISSSIDYNEKSYIKFIIAISGIFNQLILYLVFYLLVRYNFISFLSYNIFLRYNRYIILFNLLPIYPLDGIRVLSSLIENIVSFRFHLYIVNFISVCFIVVFIFSVNSFEVMNILFFLIYKTYESIFNVGYIYNKFLLERFLNKYVFRRVRYVGSINGIYKNRFNFINNVSEDKVLSKRFNYYEKL